ncbi:MAG: hypothetical protein OXC55_07480 [Chloroflexi bacterium]|nr:hypothetical protein [Chloroflexota bacterium]
MTTTSEHESNAGAEEHKPADEIADANQGEVAEETAPDGGESSSTEKPSIEAMQSELAARDERVSALEEQVISLERELSTTVSRYRLALLDTAPEVPGDLVSGETAEDLESSLAKAKGVVEQVRTRLLEGMESTSQDTEQPLVGIPAGAPPRTLNDGSADLSAREKITLGLERM